MPFTIDSENVQTLRVADCVGISQMQIVAQSERAAIETAPDIVIEGHFRRMSQALDAKNSARRAAVDAVHAAQAASGGQLLALSRSAVKSGADLFVAIAVQTRNPQLIGAAVGVDLVIDGADFVHQIIRADNNLQQQRAIYMLLADRTAMVQSLVSGPGRTFSQRQYATAQAFTMAMKEIGKTAINEARLKARLDVAEQALKEIETQVAGLPVNNNEMRQYLADALSADLFVLSILQNEFSQSDCRIDTLPPPG